MLTTNADYLTSMLHVLPFLVIPIPGRDLKFLKFPGVELGAAACETVILPMYHSGRQY